MMPGPKFALNRAWLGSSVLSGSSPSTTEPGSASEMASMKCFPTWCRSFDKVVAGPVFIPCSEEGEGGIV